MAPSEGVVDDSMLSMVELVVDQGLPQKRKREENAEGENGETKKDSKRIFEIRSPLLAAKSRHNRDTCVENVCPFWGLLRTGTWRPDAHNMELETSVFVSTSPELKGFKFPKMPRIFLFHVHIPIARNRCNIQKDEVLCLPMQE